MSDKRDDDTPMNNALIEYRLAELAKMCQTILDKMDESSVAFNNHVREDIIIAEHLKQLMEERKDSRGLWAGIGGAAAGAASAIYAFVKG